MSITLTNIIWISSSNHVFVDAPKNVTASSEGEQTFGRELTLTCDARSKPAVSSFEWMKKFNGQLKTVGHERKLRFHSLNISDSGQFICIANNYIGKTRSHSVDIRVKCEYFFLVI